MTRPHLIARLIFAAMGIYFFMYSLGEIGGFFITLCRDFPPETFESKVFTIIVKLIVTFAVSLILLFRPDRLIQWISGLDADKCEKIDNIWIIAGFRMTACLCGLLILGPHIERLFYYIPAIIKGPNVLSYLTLEGQSSVVPVKHLVGLLVEVVKLIFAIYLIFGAPHYVRRQMRAIKVKEQNQSSGVEENEQN